jgi:hypothetical protein
MVFIERTKSFEYNGMRFTVRERTGLDAMDYEAGLLVWHNRQLLTEMGYDLDNLAAIPGHVMRRIRTFTEWLHVTTIEGRGELAGMHLQDDAPLLLRAYQHWLEAVRVVELWKLWEGAIREVNREDVPPLEKDEGAPSTPNSNGSLPVEPAISTTPATTSDTTPN